MLDHPEKSGLPLSAREKAKLAAILARLASPHEGERAAAGLLATTFLTKHNLAWTDLIDASISRPQIDPIDPPTKGDRRRSGNKLWRGYCRRRPITRGGIFDLAA